MFSTNSLSSQSIDAATATTIKSPPPPLSLPPIFQSSSLKLITQGAEALLYQTNFLLPTLPCALKFRPSKPYRHPTLDARLTKHRILAEARVLTKCRRHGVPVPALYGLDEHDGWLVLEWIEGKQVRVCVNEWLQDGRDENHNKLRALMARIGAVVGGMHAVGVVHGDLTTSNLMLRRVDGSGAMVDGDVMIIDFGLAAQSSQDEDRAVDLYLLERAFRSTHPMAESLFFEVLGAYGKSYKAAHSVLRKLQEVRLRGRKRSMLG